MSNNEFLKFLETKGVPQKVKNKQPLHVQEDLEFALTIILVELASSDEGFAHIEYNTIISRMRMVFGTDREKVRLLINRAVVTLNNLRGTSEYAILLKENLPEPKLLQIIDAIDDVIGADGVLDDFEVYNRLKYIRLLGLEKLIEKKE